MYAIRSYYAWVTISSVGSVAATTAGGCAGAPESGSAFGMACTRSAGGLLVGLQGPSGSLASYQKVPLLR